MAIRSSTSPVSKLNFFRGIRSMAAEDEQRVLCLNVWCGDLWDDRTYRWYCIAPPISQTPQKRPCNGGLNSKIHIIRNYDTRDQSMPPPLDIDTSSQQITVRNGQPMIGIMASPSAVTLDGKLHVFSGDVQPSYEVFDPTTNQWEALPPPSDGFQETIPYQPVPYEKEKKILFPNYNDNVSMSTFDVATNSWEYGGYPLLEPSVLAYGSNQDLSTLLARTYMGGRVILGDLLYMFLEPNNDFFAYDLKNKQLLQVHGLEGETEFLYRQSDQYSLRRTPVFLFQLGKEDLCLVSAQGPVCGGLHVICLKFKVQKRYDGDLQVVLLGRDSYYIDDGIRLEDCVAIKRPGLRTSAIPCFYDPDSGKQEV
ncbi:hypothetical protein ACHQM5_001156 [Ranunculus cassubicifolius]